ncbi:iron chaperone [Rhodococcus sp. NPDC059234]|uniref:iron chaperone n=1 Tax=Rhodococcus sp. NPDC059234 TaxID=3346781 RepID=UPI00366E7688
MTAQQTITAKTKSAVGFSTEERAAMKEHAQELKTAARRGSRATRADGEQDVLMKIAEMGESDRVLAEGIHAAVKASAPSLTPKLWYGMPAYASDGKVVCFFRSAEKFKSRYATFGFEDKAILDDGTMWPTSFALTEWTSAAEKKVGELVKKAVG